MYSRAQSQVLPACTPASLRPAGNWISPAGSTSLCQLHPVLGLDLDSDLYPHPMEVGLGVVASLPVSKREEKGLEPSQGGIFLCAAWSAL